MKHSTWLFACGVVVGAFAACGGADQSTLFDDSGTPVAPDGSVTPDGGPNHDDAATQDATVDDGPSIVDVVTVDVPILPADSRIQCGPKTTCSAQTEICCETAGTTAFTYQCVGSVGDCSSDSQVAITCSSQDNCASQGNSGFVCCAAAGGPQNPNQACAQYSTVSSTQCQTACDPQQGEFEIGCDPQQQNCTDNTQTCILSKCSLPGYGICQ